MKFTPHCSSYQQKLLPRMRYLVAAVASLMIMPPSQADAAQNNIGDLEIYKAAEGGKVTITMMLDTSGSMTQTQAGSNACDLPNGVISSTTDYKTSYEDSATTPSYKRYYCTAAQKRYYYYYIRTGVFRSTWYRCGASDGSGSVSTADCTTEINAPNTNGYEHDDGFGYGYYYKMAASQKYYDRLTRLKDAIFTLMDNTSLDSSKVSVGIGQFSSQSDSSNTIGTPDGRSGKIVVPAGLLTKEQRTLIKNEVAKMIGGNGTPTANAYAESGAYMLATNTTNSSYSAYSGFDRSVSSSKNNNNLVYKSPLTGLTGQCNGQGIYFLTDGYPNSSGSNIANTLMSKSLNVTSISPDTGLINVKTGNDEATVKAWDYIGAYAKKLRDTANPIRMTIKTATVGFGSEFNNPNGLPTKKVTIGGEEVNVTDCDQLSTQDAINLCKWGEKSYNYGEGGFYSAQSTDDVINSIVKFVSDLNQEIPAAPSGTITVPDDPYRADSQLAVAYYPMVEAKVSEARVIWPGNVKKYNLNAGTLYGKSGQPLFTGVSGDLNPSTQDLWSDRDYPNANNAVTSGGFYAQLKTPNTGISSVRTLYIEDLTSTGATTTKLRKFAVNTNGKLTLDGNPITDSNTFNDTSTYTTNTVTKLLNFLGFNNISVATTGTDVAKLSGITLTPANATTPIKVVGATIHSAPNAVSYSATLDDDGRVTDSRDDYVLFGSMDGAVHLVNSDNYGSGSGGQEKFAVILRKMMSSQPDALVKDATQTAIGAPKAGVDAPWLVTADYKYDFPSKRVNIDTSGSGTTQKGVFAYGGLRMGGEGFYGLNLSNYDSPTMLFSIDASTSGFDRMGQIWSKPTKAKIKTSATDTGTDVLIFGGGYDTCYEDENYQVGTITSTLTNQRGSSCNRTTNREALGNAVYIINAKTGALIWSATKTANSKGTSNTTNNNLNNSIVGGITVLDRNNDGYMDGIYFADLGGQVFRADFTNAGDNTYNKSTTDNKYTPAVQTSFSNQRVTRILQPRYAIANTLGAITTNADAKYNLRFYERPVVSFFRDDNSKLFAMVNVISGDRSSPLSKIRPIDKADRLYGIIDNDVTKANSIFFANDFTTTNANKQTVVDLADTDLVNVPTALGTMPTAGYSLETKNGVINTLKNNSKKGWYYPLTRFDGYANVLYNKGVGKSEVINSMLYTTVYNPDMSYGEANPCSAQIVGGSERELYCLPYGVCMDDTSTTGTGGFLQAGQGIQELTLGPYSSSKTNIRLLIGNTSLTQRSTLDSRFSYGIDNRKDTSLLKTRQVAGGNTSITQIGGDGSAAEYLYRERYTLYPKTWYEVFN
ncbi:pilus assembly protein PilY [Enhydrobacter aerosaccus]|uniref:Pilus assembly protein PilY n=1 Tax=Enhydrobacter aerosaccus TaxID=225324 RepID=A0ABR5IJJ0_9HYPH|nr:pilus assembly protein PilY [Enhydrobacter aerosaccus]KND18859.1 pilus assembly protein PilY [Enhydrobacter aerosaccus]